MEKIETKAVEKKVVIVTGTSRGLGEALALELDGRGWMVFGCSRTKPAPSAPGARLRWKPCDVTRKEECLRIVSDVVFATGRLDALVNNAGAYSRDLPVRRKYED